MGGIGLWKDNSEPQKSWSFPTCKGGVVLHFLYLSANINDNVTRILTEYPEQEGFHKDHGSLSPKRSILMDAPACQELGKPLSEHKLHIESMQLKEATTALWTAQMVSLGLYQAGIFLNFYHLNFLDFLLSVPSCLCCTFWTPHSEFFQS